MPIYRLILRGDKERSNDEIILDRAYNGMRIIRHTPEEFFSIAINSPMNEIDTRESNIYKGQINRIYVTNKYDPSALVELEFFSDDLVDNRIDYTVTRLPITIISWNHIRAVNRYGKTMDFEVSTSKYLIQPNSAHIRPTDPGEYFFVIARNIFLMPGAYHARLYIYGQVLKLNVGFISVVLEDQTGKRYTYDLWTGGALGGVDYYFDLWKPIEGIINVPVADRYTIYLVIRMAIVSGGAKDLYIDYFTFYPKITNAIAVSNGSVDLVQRSLSLELHVSQYSSFRVLISADDLAKLTIEHKDDLGNTIFIDEYIDTKIKLTHDVMSTKIKIKIENGNPSAVTNNCKFSFLAR